MNCPYCSEEIKESATVCRFCKRDLSFFHPFMSRITTLEESVSQLQQTVMSLQVRSTGAEDSGKIGILGSQGSKSNLGMFPLIAGTAVTALGAALAYRLQRHGGSLPRVAFLGFSSPLPLAVYIAVRQPYVRISQFLCVGALQGAAMSFVSLVDAFLTYTPKSGPTGMTVAKNLVFGVVLVATYVLFYASVGLFRVHLTRPKGMFSHVDLSARVAYNLMGRPKIIPGGNIENRWKRVSDITAALGPILTLIGSIIVGYLGTLKAR